MSNQNQEISLEEHDRLLKIETQRTIRSNLMQLGLIAALLVFVIGKGLAVNAAEGIRKATAPQLDTMSALHRCNARTTSETRAPECQVEQAAAEAATQLLTEKRNDPSTVILFSIFGGGVEEVIQAP